MRGDLGERSDRRVWRIGQRGVHRRIAVRQAGRVPPIAGLAKPDPATGGLTRRSRGNRAPRGPIALVNSFASGGALFSVVLRVAA